jgi:hypothetical protein
MKTGVESKGNVVNLPSKCPITTKEEMPHDIPQTQRKGLEISFQEGVYSSITTGCQGEKQQKAGEGQTAVHLVYCHSA